MSALDIWELRFASRLSRGQEPGVEVSATKVLGAGLMQRITELGMQAMGYYGLPYEPDMLTAAHNTEPVAPAYGTTETLRYLMKRRRDHLCRFGMRCRGTFWPRGFLGCEEINSPIHSLMGQIRISRYRPGITPRTEVAALLSPLRFNQEGAHSVEPRRACRNRLQCLFANRGC